MEEDEERLLEGTHGTRCWCLGRARRSEEERGPSLLPAPGGAACHGYSRTRQTARGLSREQAPLLRPMLASSLQAQQGTAPELLIPLPRGSESPGPPAVPGKELRWPP